LRRGVLGGSSRLTALPLLLLLLLLLLLPAVVPGGSDSRCGSLAAGAAAVAAAIAAVTASLDAQGSCASMGHSQSCPLMPRALLSPSARMPSNCQPVCARKKRRKGRSVGKQEM
jgi:hypothetical protein